MGNQVTDIYAWIDAQVDICKNNVEILEENKMNIDKMIIQFWCLKKHVDSTLDFLERKKKYESEASKDNVF